MLPQLQTHQMDIHLFDFSPAICMSSMCVQLFKFEEATGFKVICTLASALKSKMATISMETKREKKIILIFSPYFFILIINDIIKVVG